MNDVLTSTKPIVGEHIPQIQEPTVIPQMESKSMRRWHIFSLIECGHCNRIIKGSHMAIDFPGRCLALNFNG